jgi:hypothetical protein
MRKFFKFYRKDKKSSILFTLDMREKMENDTCMMNATLPMSLDNGTSKDP